MPSEGAKVKKDKSYKEIMECAGDIVLHSGRHSKDTPGSAEKLGQIRDKYAARNEGTFVMRHWGKWIRDDREVEVTKDLVQIHVPVATDLMMKAWEKQAWDVDNLDDNWNREFITDQFQ